MTDCKLVSERVNELREQVLAFCKGTAPGTGATSAASCATS